MNTRLHLARVLARAALADAAQGHEAHAVAARFAATVGRHAPWQRPLADTLTGWALWHAQDAETLAARLLPLPEFNAAFEHGTPRARRLILRPPAMGLLPFALEALDLPVLPTAGDLAVWLGTDAERLAWLTSPALGWRGEPLTQHYRTRWSPKRSGGLRVIEAPRPELRLAQRRLLDGLLAQVPAHEACHGFVRGRSPRTHAALHTGHAVVLRLDLRDFFPHVRAARVHALWRTLGYPPAVARTLTALVTTRTPRAALGPAVEQGRIARETAHRLAGPHLPQGAPTSPALANLCAFGLDLRLDGLAQAFGATYSRYADDLAFSGPPVLRARVDALLAWAGAIAADEGFALHRGKTRVMPAHRAQQVAGITVNRNPNLPRAAYDGLRAQLHGCVTHGPAAHNREGHADLRAHLRGRIAWAAQLNPQRAARLQALFERIDWSR